MSASRQAKSGTRKNVVRCPGDVVQGDADVEDSKREKFDFREENKQGVDADTSWVRTPDDAVQPNLGSNAEGISTPR